MALNEVLNYVRVFTYTMCLFVTLVFCVADNSDVSATKHLHVYDTCLVERNRLLPHVWRPYVEDVEVRP
jgi:hypothetical protein